MTVLSQVKRFNEEVNCAPAPNAYDAKLAQSKAGVALTKSQRFEESKVGIALLYPGPDFNFFLVKSYYTINSQIIVIA